MVKAFPTLTDEELAEACSQLEANASGRLDGTGWLGLSWHEKGVLQIKKQCLVEKQRETDDGEEPEGDCESMKFKDEFTLNRPATASTITVDFSIIISPTYRVPVLWFIFGQLPSHGPQGIDAVYQYVVPASSKAQVKAPGIMGGISMAHHPISELPAFFIHPCNTEEALRSLQQGSNLSPYQYLLLWLGLIGPSVGLYIPSQLLSVIDEDAAPPLPKSPKEYDIR